LANEPRFADTPPARIVPTLADEGIYIASESSFYRVLRAHGQMNRRGRAQPPRTSRPPTTHIATAPAEVWCWDVTFLPAQIQGRWFYLYLILDLYSRKIVGFEVHDTDSADHAAHLARRTALAEGVHATPVRPVLHGDNGATLKATTVLAMLHWLGIKPSYSRPRVSDDNPFVEALFRTVKYRPEFPLKGFADLQAAREWSARFVLWYNNAIHDAGVGRPATGRQSSPSPSIRSATLSSGRQHHKSCFPVRSVSLLSRPDLATPKPRRATQEMGGAEPPGATRRAPWRASLVRLASTGPSPK
jgi:putative transposase